MTRFIAEVGSNHNGSYERALEFVETAAKLGCHGIKFQQFKVRWLYAPEALERYPQLLWREKWETPEDWHSLLSFAARSRGLLYGVTPYYLEAVDVLEPHVDFFKISSYQLLYEPMLRAVARTQKPIIVSTGMATLAEVLGVLDVLQEEDCTPELLHCVSAYPAPASEANLAAIVTLRRETDCDVGWSDHTRNSEVLLSAMGHRAGTVEYHLDLDGKGAEYAHGHCWLPDEIRPVIELSHDETLVAVDGEWEGRLEKRPQPSEIEQRLWRGDPSDGLRPLVEIRPALLAEARA